MIDGWGISGEITFKWMSLGLADDRVIIGSGNDGLMMPGNKLLPEPMVTNCYDINDVIRS